MKKIITTLIVFSISFNLANAQLNCGTIVSQSEYNNAKNLSIQSLPSNKTTSDKLKIQIFIVCSGSTPSTGAVTSTDAINALTTLNTKFSGTGIEFEQCSGIKYVLNSNHFDMAYTSNQQPNEDGMCRQNDMKNTINLYIVNKIGGGSIGGYAYLNGGAYNRVFMAKKDLFGNNNDIGLILSHEMGHFFGLLHTCGWSSGGSTNELVNGTNSTSAGDLVGDTPADPAQNAYLLSSGSSCTYPWGVPSNPCTASPTFCDANGDTYVPLGDNLMFPKYCQSFNTLTTGQENRIWSTYQSIHLNKFNGEADLITKDNWGDPGFEPNNLSSMGTWNDIWGSPDLWNCRTNGCTGHENPGYLNPATNDNYMRVRIKNNGCGTSLPAKMHLYWTLGSTMEYWPNAWTTDQLCNLDAGKEITPSAGLNIPALNTNQEYIITQAWDPVDPTQFTCMTLLPHSDGKPMICFLSRIVSNDDPMYNEQLNVQAGPNVINNNNISTRNTSILALQGNKTYPIKGGVVTQLIKNDFEVAQNFDLVIDAVNNTIGTTFTDIGSILMTLDDQLWQDWANGGFQNTGIEIYDIEKHQIKVLNGVLARISNIEIPPQTYREVEFCYYLNEEVDAELQFEYLLSQQLSEEPNVPLGTSCQYIVRINSDDGSYKTSESDIASRYVQSKENQYRLIPNPVNNNAVLSFYTQQTDNLSIEIIDITGRVLKNIILEQIHSGNNSKIINFDFLNGGIYFIKPNGKNDSQLIKFIKN